MFGRDGFSSVVLAFLVGVYCFVNVKADYGCEAGCPGLQDHSSATECCIVNNTMTCCNPSAYYINNELVQCVGIIVISSCIVLAILIVVCCFSPRCPLYNVCRADYGNTQEVPYNAKEDDGVTLPLTSGSGQHGYNVTIKPVAEV